MEYIIHMRYLKQTISLHQNFFKTVEKENKAAAEVTELFIC